MIITKIKGEFVRQYPSINIEFPKEGLMNLNGPNGAGKTTILMLIELALFGAISGVKATEIKYDQAKKSQKWWVELTFAIDGNEYCVYRHENTAKATFKVNGKDLITGGQKEVTEHIVQKVMRMDQASFSNAFYARQDDLDNLIKLRPEERKKEISRLLRIDKLDESIKNVRKDKNHLVTQIDEQNRYIKNNDYFIGIEAELNTSLNAVMESQKQQEILVNDTEKQYKDSLKQKETLDNKYEKHQYYLSASREKEKERKKLNDITLHNIRLELEEIKHSKEEFSNLQTDVQKYDSVMTDLQKMQQVQVVYSQKKQLVQHTETLKARLSTKKERIELLKPKLPTVDFIEKIRILEKQTSEIEEHNSSLNNEMIELKGNLTYVKNEGKRLKAERNELQNLGSNSPCPVCKRAMGEHFHSLSNDYGTELLKLTNDHQSLSATIKEKENQKLENQLKISALRRNKNEVESEQRKVTAIENEIKMLQQDFQTDKQDYLNVQNQLDGLKDIQFDEEEFKSLTNEVSRLQMKKERFGILASLISKEPKLLVQEKEVNEEIIALNFELSNIEMDLKEMNFNLEEYRLFQNKINQEVELLRKTEKELSFIKEQRKNIELKKEQLDKERKDNETEIAKLEARRKELAMLIKTEEIFKNFKVDRMAKVRPRIQNIMQELLSFITDGKYDLVSLDDDYKVFVYRNEVKKPIHLFSGGEQKLIALCMRLAISRILTSQGEHKNFEYLALDEVLSSMDEGRQETIIDALKKLTTVFKQILMITHNSNIKDRFEYTLQIEQNTDLSSRAYWISDTGEENVS